MEKVAFLLISCVLVAVLPIGHAQFPANNEWEFGWDTDVEPSYDLELDGDKWEIEDTLVFYVDNPRLSDLSLTITVEFENDVDVLETSYSESISVGSQSNETFSIELSTSDAEKVRSHSPSEQITMIVTAEESAAGGAGSPKEIEADLNVPRHHKLLPEVSLAVSSVDAGTWVEETLLLNNMGNTVDAASKIEADIRNCPLLEIEGLESGENTQIQPTDVDGNQPAEVSFRIAPSTAHASKTCEVTMIVTSEGNGLERSVTFSIDVDASGGNQNSNNGDTGSSSSNSGSESDGSSALPALGPQTVIFSLGLLALLRRNRLDVC
ncbi:MAG: hypothetical protein CL959_02570 [Euryarchaeota archaeon]|nr:hypothetical protein [Euryarchaeota archaeon]